MTSLTICAADKSGTSQTITDYREIADILNGVGVLLEHWETGPALADDADQETVLAAYRKPVERLNDKYAFQSVDVVSLRPDHPQKRELREKFLAEHTHSDFEIRLFVDGSGLFYLHIDGRVYMLMCTAGDLVSVPANTTHWFDMGENPSFKCIRFFTTENGWVGDFTGSQIAKQFPSYDEHVASLA